MGLTNATPGVSYRWEAASVSGHDPDFPGGAAGARASIGFSPNAAALNPTLTVGNSGYWRADHAVSANAKATLRLVVTYDGVSNSTAAFEVTFTDRWARNAPITVGTPGGLMWQWLLGAQTVGAPPTWHWSLKPAAYQVAVRQDWDPHSIGAIINSISVEGSTVGLGTPGVEVTVEKTGIAWGYRNPQGWTDYDYDLATPTVTVTKASNTLFNVSVPVLADAGKWDGRALLLQVVVRHGVTNRDGQNEGNMRVGFRTDLEPAWGGTEEENGE